MKPYFYQGFPKTKIQTSSCFGNSWKKVKQWLYKEIMKINS